MTRRFLKLGGLGFGGLLLALVLFSARPQIATALGCDNWYGRACWVGYFDGAKVVTGGPDVISNVINEGMPGIQSGNKPQFINTVIGYLNSGDRQRVTAAQFIILTMIGNNAGVPRSVSPAQLKDWQDRINSPAIIMRVEMAPYLCDIANAYYQVVQNDIAAGYSDPPGCGPGVLNEMIDFYSGGTLVYRIRVVCANPLGRLPGLPTPPNKNLAPEVKPPPPFTRPYFQVTGGDVAAGASIETGVGQPCAAATSTGVPNPRGGIVSWNRRGSPDFAGAGGQYGAFAMDFIQDFVTGQGNGRVTPGQETNQLTFANTSYSGSVDIPQGLFGGMFGDAPCIDYWSGRPAAVKAPPNNSPATWPNGTYYVKSQMTLQSGIIPAGRQITLYVEDKVAITGTGITYAPGPYANRANIPSFKLIVNGTIYIGSSVSALDGLYAAIPDPGGDTKVNQFASPIPGTISTCSTGFTSYNPAEPPVGSIFDPCNRQLTVTGSVAANQIWLLRTFGTLGGGQAAEVFRYSPEIWLAPAGSNGGYVPDYQSVVGLPPIL